MHGKEYDFVVVGGGLAGVFAALAAARKGVRTALVDKQPYLGGNASPLLGVPPQGAMGMGYNRYSDETGLAAELRDRVDRCGQRSCAMYSQILWEMTAREEYLDCHVLTEAVRPIMLSKDEIKAIHLRHITNGQESMLNAGVFADCSGDGDIACKAGAHYMIGREAKETFGESMAPDKADDGIMGATLNFTTRELPFPIPFTSPEGTPRFSDADLPEHNDVTGMAWWLEYANSANVFNKKELYRKHLGIIFAFWDHLKNRGDHGVDNRIIDFIAPDVSRRESRRFTGDYVLTENDIVNGRDFDDAVAFGGWPIDLHPPNGIFSGKPPAVQRFVEPYAIPYRSLYSSNIKNLFFAGRDASVSHVALGTTRVIWTCAVMGEAVGHAAVLCQKYKCLPRDIYEKHSKELKQELLKSDCYIPGEKNEDPDDKARNAKVTVSSTQALRVEGIDEFVLLKDAALVQTLPISENKLDSLYLYIRNKSEKKAILGCRIFRCGQKVQLMFSRESEIAASRTEVPSGHNDWLEIPLNIATIERGAYWWRVESAGELEIGITHREIIGCQRGHREADTGDFKKYVGYHDDPKATWIPDIATYSFRTVPLQHPFGGENIVNGVAHPEMWPNLWISDSSLSMPQEVTLEFPGSRKFSRALLTFDTGLNLDRTKKTGREECVKDYELWTYAEKRWMRIHSEEDNDMRRRKHDFPREITCEKFKLKVLATRGSPAARLFEIRLY